MRQVCVMSTKGGLLGTLSALAVGVGLGLSPAEVEAQAVVDEACEIIQTLGVEDVGALQAIVAGDESSPLLEGVPNGVERCRQVALDRLLALAGTIEPAAGPGGGGGLPGEVYDG